MKEFTEKHHAYIAATFYKQLTEAFGERGEKAFIMATQRYAEQRGGRMAQRAIRDGKNLDFATYREYGEWVNTKTVIEEECSNQGETLSYFPDHTEHVTRCPWATQFKEMEMEKAGTVYCTHLDKSIVRGFNPYLVFEVPQSMHENEYCIQTMRDANFKEGQTFVKKAENLKGFDYHCGHCYKTFSEITAAIFQSEGYQTAAAVLEQFADTYGRDMADHLLGFYKIDFNII